MNMNVKITENTCEVENNVILNSGEYNIHKFHFTFSEEYLDEYVKKALFINKNKTPYEMVIANNECEIPNELLVEPGQYMFGVYAYEIDGNNLILRYSPEPTHFYVNKGSYIDNAQTPTKPTPDEFEQYYQAMQTLINDAKPELIDYIEENLPTIFVGKTTTLTPGSEATVVNVGTERNPIFDFGIPKGDPGTTDYNELDNKPDLSVYSTIIETANKIRLEIDNQTFKMKAKLYDKYSTLLAESNEIDLPLESVVVSGRYDKDTKTMILTLENGGTIEIPLNDLVSGLVDEEELNRRLDADIKINSISKNGTRLAIDTNKNVNIKVPVSTNDLINNSGFITNEVDNLERYYNKTASDTRYPLVTETATNVGLSFDNSTYVMTVFLKDRNGRIISNQSITFPFASIDSEISNLQTNKANVTDLNTETERRINADLNLQGQIDTITLASDVVDIVGTYQDLQNYPTSELTDEDIIKVLVDSTHNDALSYYRWSAANSTWSYVGSEGPFYTKAESNALLNNKQDNITSSNKLDSDLVDDTNSINKFVTDADKTNWNNKEDEANKVTEINSNSTNIQYPSAKCVYDDQQLQNEEINSLKMLYNILPTTNDEDTNITLNDTGKMTFKEIDLNGNTSQVVISGEAGTNINATSININDVNTSKEHTTGLDGNTYQETIQAEAGTNINATSININDVNTSKEHTIQMSGNTYQETTTGKQLLNFTDETSTYLNVTRTIQNGIITLNGTPDSVNYNYSIYHFTATQTGTYTLLPFKSETNTHIRFIYTINNGSYISDDQYTQISLTSGDVLDIHLRIDSTDKITNFVLKPMLYFGTDVVTSWEEYTGGQQSPNPSYPQNIEVVTGLNDINICGKNLFDKNNITQGYIKQDGSINTSNTEWAISNYINVTSGDNYTYQGLTDIGNAPYSAYYDKNKSFLSSFKQQIGTNTITIPSNAYYVRFTVRVSVQDENTFMFEKGSTASTYESYTGTTYPINLGKNLFDKSNVNLITLMKSANDNYFVYAPGVKSAYIKIKPNTTYTVSKIQSARFALYLSTNIPSTNVVINNTITNSTATSLTITSGENDNYLTVYYYLNGTDTLTEQEILDTIQIEKGSTATSYSPYFTPIELCKINTYQDKIYKINDKWYLEKNIGNIVLNGSENWVVSTDSYQAGVYNLTTNTTADIAENNSLCNFYSIFNRYTNVPNSYGISTGYVRIRNENLLNPTDFKQWLSNNNVIIYYPFETPTTTEIIDTNLVNQLNALYNATIYPITNINTDTSNLLPYIDLQYNVVTPSPSPNRPSNIDITTGENDITICGKNSFNINASYYKRRNVDNVSISGDNIIVQNEETSAHQFVWWNIPIGIGKQITISYDSLTETNSNTNNAVSYLFNNELYTTFTDFTDFTKIDKTNKYATTTSTGKYLVIGLRTISSATNTLSKLQVEVGSNASTYEAYQGNTYPINLGNIELCKINTYQDKIYKRNDKWYLEKNINKVVLNGSESWAQQTSTSPYIYRNTKTDYLRNDTNICKSNYFESLINGGTTGMTNGTCRFRYNANDSYTFLYICTEDSSTADDFKTWLSTHNTIVYYVLATPTTTEITDTTLVNQLNALYNSTLYATTNINTDTSNLLPYIDLQYNVVTPSPSPSRPSVVNVVKGSNTITIESSNLFKIPNGTYTDTYTLTINDNKGYFEVSTNKVINVATNFTLKAGTYTLTNGGYTYPYFTLKSNNTNIVALESVDNGTKTFTLTNDTTINSVAVYQTTSVYASKNFIFQINKGSTALEFQPYQNQTYPINLGDMELCKIGTYQDYIYESNGNWFKKGNVGKIVLNGSENWRLSSTGTENWSYRLTTRYTTETRDSFCNYYPIAYNISSTNTTQGIQLAFNGELRIRYGKEDTLNNFQTWLSSHNIILYYVPISLTDTQITDTTLITQLNNIKKAYSYDTQTNISQINTDKPFIIYAEAFRDLRSILD